MSDLSRSSSLHNINAEYNKIPSAYWPWQDLYLQMLEQVVWHIGVYLEVTNKSITNLPSKYISTAAADITENLSQLKLEMTDGSNTILKLSI